MNRGRRHALALGAGMVAASGLAVLATPVRNAGGLAPLDLAAIIPSRFAAWDIDPIATAFVRAGEGRKTNRIYDQVLERTFVNPEGARIMLSAALCRQQSSRIGLHRPEVCYRAAGFEIRDVEPVVLDLAPGSLAATRLRAARPGRPEPITYWMMLGGVVTGDAAQARWRGLTSAMRREALDGLLVRISSIDPDARRAFALQAGFIAEMHRAISPQNRERIVGAAA
jgi:EpsI family protein